MDLENEEMKQEVINAIGGLDHSDPSDNLISIHEKCWTELCELGDQFRSARPSFTRKLAVR